MVLLSYASALDWAEQKLIQSSESAKLDAQVLLVYVIEKSSVYIKTWPEKLLTQTQQLTFQQLVEQRLSGKPIAYITGEKEFWSLPLSVSPATLIPRPDTEILVEQVLARVNQQQLTCLDLGTGTGAIALALASEQPHWHITGVDNQIAAIELAQYNAKKLGLTHVEFIQSNWFSAVNQQLFDVIVSNPPYIDVQDPHLEQGDVQFEPRTALVAENQGLQDIVSIVKEAKQYLTLNGLLVIEHGYQQALAVQQIFHDNGYQNIETIKDYGNNDRITLGYLNADH